MCPRWSARRAPGPGGDVRVDIRRSPGRDAPGEDHDVTGTDLGQQHHHPLRHRLRSRCVAHAVDHGRAPGRLGDDDVESGPCRPTAPGRWRSRRGPAPGCSSPAARASAMATRRTGMPMRPQARATLTPLPPTRPRPALARCDATWPEAGDRQDHLVAVLGLNTWTTSRACSGSGPDGRRGHGYGDTGRPRGHPGVGVRRGAGRSGGGGARRAGGEVSGIGIYRDVRLISVSGVITANPVG